jgi:hypothetical protein
MKRPPLNGAISGKHGPGNKCHHLQNSKLVWPTLCGFPLLYLAVTLETLWELHRYPSHDANGVLLLSKPLCQTTMPESPFLGSSKPSLTSQVVEPATSADRKRAVSNSPADLIPTTPAQQRLSRLYCQAHGGPEQAQEMVYWQDIPADTSFRSPYREPWTPWPRKYMVRTLARPLRSGFLLRWT